MPQYPALERHPEIGAGVVTEGSAEANGGPLPFRPGSPRHAGIALIGSRAAVVHGHSYMPRRPSAVPSFVPKQVARGTKSSRRHLVLVIVGIVCILAGISVVAVPLYQAYQRDSTDQSAMATWQHSGSTAVAGAVPGQAVTLAAPAALDCGSAAPSDFGLVTFNDPAPYGYAGVAGNGTWDMLHNRSMVHYAGTPAAGGVGNVIVAFHREPNYQHIDQLDVGGVVSIQNHSCQVFKYRITQRWTLDPSKVTQLTPTTGHELTLITCTPFWQDTQRLVWRAELITA